MLDNITCTNGRFWKILRDPGTDSQIKTHAKAVPRTAGNNKQETEALLFIPVKHCFAYLRMHLELMKA